MLQGLVNVGQNAASMTGTAGQNYANQTGQNTMGAANAQAAGQVGTANAITGVLSNGANTFSQANMINALNQRNPNQFAGFGGGSQMPDLNQGFWANPPSMGAPQNMAVVNTITE